jgi:PEP-CTERM motif
MEQPVKQNLRLALSTVAAGVFALALGIAAAPVHAVIILGPGDTTCTTNDNSNLTDAQVSTLATNCFNPGGTAFVLSLAYKDNVGGAEEGPFATSYETTYFNTPADPADALIEYISGLSITCPACFLLVKDGSQDPAQYLFDISSWNGTESIELLGFWPADGAISHIAIYTGQEVRPQPPPTVPEPGTLLLLGMAALGLAVSRRRSASGRS